VLVAAFIMVGVLARAGAALLLDAWWGRRRVDLADRLLPYRNGFGGRRGPTLAPSSELSGRAPGQVWINLSDAAGRLGLSHGGFVSLGARSF
jgi:hypothetical protein